MSTSIQNVSQIFPIHVVPSIKNHVVVKTSEAIVAEPEVEPALEDLVSMEYHVLLMRGLTCHSKL